MGLHPQVIEMNECKNKIIIKMFIEGKYGRREKIRVLMVLRNGHACQPIEAKTAKRGGSGRRLHLS
jgi:hypothetical protein